MARNKNALIRYKALDKCFSNKGRRYFIEDLLEECNKALSEYDPSTGGIQKRQLYKDINFMKSMDGFNAPIERLNHGRRIYFQYSDPNFSISNQPLNEDEATQLKSALAVLSRFEGLPQFDWIYELSAKLNQEFNLIEDGDQNNEIISFEENPYLTGKAHIKDLFNAIYYKQVLQIIYHPFQKKSAQSIIISPQYLKQYNNRWFLFALNHEYENISNFPLDRIKEINHIDDDYIKSDIDFREYFYDVIGVTVKEDEEPIKITLEVDSSLAPYIKTKPIHGSQKIVEEKDNSTIISIKVIPNYELYNTLFGFGSALKVVEPDSVSEKIVNSLKISLNTYNS